MSSCSEPQPGAPLRRRALLAAGLLLAAAAWAQPVAMASGPPPAADGLPPALEVDAAAGLSVHEFDWLDARRQRVVPVRLYLPLAASAAQPVPLVVFSHGIGGSRRGYSYLGRHWAAQGWASLHLQHVGSDRSLWSGNPLAMAGRLQAAAQDSEATARVQDLRFALDQLLAGPLAGRVDASRIVAAGHSYGANTTLLAVGAQVAREGRVLDLRDARLKAAIVISAPPFYGEPAVDRVLGAIDVPSLHVTATEDVIRVPGYFSPASDRLAVFDATGGPHKVLAVFDGGSHSIFTDRAGTGGVALNPQVKAATQALSTAFLRSLFGVLDGGRDEPLLQWRHQYQALLARFELRPGRP